ncbi:subtilisin-like protease-like protein, partial [Trifolium pratense]
NTSFWYPVAHLSKVKTEYGIKPAPYVASFSSRGPNPIDPAILKPDITAPGVGIIAAYGGSEGGPFIKMSGTSMACPHVSGVAALVRSIYPDWSPAKSTSVNDTLGRPMMQHNSIGLESATPFAYGAGQLQPNLVVDPGLVYDISTEDYLNYFWYRGARVERLHDFYKPGSYKPPPRKTSFNILNFNYPSITVPYIHIGHPVVLMRTVENVGCPGCLPTRTRLQERCVQVPSVCPICENEEESDWHFLFECDSSKRAWQAAGVESIITSSQMRFTTTKECILDFCRNSDRTVAGRAAMTAWVLWNNRNNWVFNHTKEQGQQLGVKANGKLCRLLATVRVTVAETVSRGQFVLGGSYVIQGRCAIHEGEASALLEAMKELSQRGFTNVLFETNSKNVANAIHHMRN